MKNLFKKLWAAIKDFFTKVFHIGKKELQEAAADFEAQLKEEVAQLEQKLKELEQEAKEEISEEWERVVKKLSVRYAQLAEIARQKVNELVPELDKKIQELENTPRPKL